MAESDGSELKPPLLVVESPSNEIRSASKNIRQPEHSMPSTSKSWREMPMDSPQENKITDMVYETMQLKDEKEIALPMDSSKGKKIMDMVYETMKLIEEKKIAMPPTPEIKKKRLSRCAGDIPRKRIKTDIGSGRTFKTGHSSKKMRGGRNIRQRTELSESDSMSSFSSRGSSR